MNITAELSPSGAFFVQMVHQGQKWFELNALICPEPEHAGAEGAVQRRERLGGLLNYYYRKAA